MCNWTIQFEGGPKLEFYQGSYPEHSDRPSLREDIEQATSWVTYAEVVVVLAGLIVTYPWVRSGVDNHEINIVEMHELPTRRR